MIQLAPIQLEQRGIRLEPLCLDHAATLAEAATDGELWKLFFTSVPHPDDVATYIGTALDGLEAGHMLPWAVRELQSDKIVGTTRYHDVVAAIDRVEIGYTWYAASWQRSFVNTTCKLMLMEHAFDELGCQVVGLRTDCMNFRSQRAIESLGAKKDGVIRHYNTRTNGSVRDVVMYSILCSEWPSIKAHLSTRLWRHADD